MVAPRFSVVLAVLLLLVAVTPLASAQPGLGVQHATLPKPTGSASAVWTGEFAYIFGGRQESVGGGSNSVFRYDPARDKLLDMTLQPGQPYLPGHFWGTSAVWTGQYAYIFGGYAGGPIYPDHIVRYDPATNQAVVMPETLPSGRYATAAVWDGTDAYIFGGNSEGAALDEIVRYNPATHEVTVLAAKLPAPALYPSAAWDGQHVYVFSDTISKFDPGLGTLTAMSATLPAGRQATSAVWDGSRFYVFGGSSVAGASSAVVAYDPVADVATKTSFKLPSARDGTSAVWAGTAGYVFGGNVFTGTAGRQILRFADPAPFDAPTDVAARPGPGAGQVTLTWRAPFGTGGAGITGYKIHAGSTAASQPEVTVVGKVLTHTFSGLGDGVGRFFRVQAYNAADGPLSLLVAAKTPTLPGPVGTDPCIAIQPATLPMATAWPSAVWTGDHAYVFGGHGAAYAPAPILRYDPATGEVVNMGALPNRVWGTSAVWTGEHAYTFGGGQGINAQNSIVRYDPATNVAVLLPERLPSLRYGTAAIWDGEHAYIFGGEARSQGPDPVFALDEIVRYTPATGEVVILDETLPKTARFLSAAWDGENAYIFGGRTDAGAYLDTIHRFSPATETLTPMTAVLPSGRSGTSAAWDGAKFHLFGGLTAAGATAEVVTFDPVADVVTAGAASLPKAAGGTSAVWTGAAGYVFGGTADGRDVLKVPASAPYQAPTRVEARAGPGAGQITLKWRNVCGVDGGPLSGYKIYNGPTAASLPGLTTVGNVGTYTFSGLGDDVRQYFKVQAYGADSLDDSPFSPVVATRTPRLPAAPQGLDLSLYKDHTRLSWQPPPGDAGVSVGSYNIYRSSMTAESALIGSTAQRSYIDPTCAVGDRCTYRVSAVNVVGEGPQSSEATEVGTGLPLAHPLVDGSVCAPTASSTFGASDKDHDGLLAVYAKNARRYTLNENHGITESPHSGSCLLVGDLDDDGQSHPGLRMQALETTVCVPDDASSISRQDLDDDGLPAAYAEGSDHHVDEFGAVSTTPHAGPCWLAGDPDDDGVARP